MECIYSKAKLCILGEYSQFNEKCTPGPQWTRLLIYKYIFIPFLHFYWIISTNTYPRNVSRLYWGKIFDLAKQYTPETNWLTLSSVSGV